MRHTTLLPMLLALTSCAAASGEWAANCTFQASGYTVSFDYTMDLEQKGKEVSGVCTITQSGYLITGVASGTAKGNDLEVTCLFSLSGYALPLTITGSVEKGDLAGVCTTQGSGMTIIGAGTMTGQ